jgi:hypothetical protein
MDGFRRVVAAPIVSLRKRMSALQLNTENESKLKCLLVETDWSMKAFRLLGLENSSVFQLRGYSALHIAQQASIMQHYLHKQIEDDELLCLKYSDPDLCPNICVLRKWNDNVSFIIHNIHVYYNITAVFMH